MGILIYTILQFISVVLTTCSVHWILVNLYTTICAPLNWMGPLITFINLGSPLCQFMNYVQFELAKHYITIWVSAGTGLIVWASSFLKLS